MDDLTGLDTGVDWIETKTKTKKLKGKEKMPTFFVVVVVWKECFLLFWRRFVSLFTICYKSNKTIDENKTHNLNNQNNRKMEIK